MKVGRLVEDGQAGGPNVGTEGSWDVRDRLGPQHGCLWGQLVVPLDDGLDHVQVVLLVGVTNARHASSPWLVLMLPLCWQENGGNGIAAIERFVGWRVVLYLVEDGWKEPYTRPLG